MVNQVAFEVIGNDMALTIAAEGGQLQLNVMEPLIAHKILDSIRLLTAPWTCCASCASTASPPAANPLPPAMETPSAWSPRTQPLYRLRNATRIAQGALESGRGVLELVREEKLLDGHPGRHPAPENMIAPRLVPLQPGWVTPHMHSKSPGSPEIKPAVVMPCTRRAGCGQRRFLRQPVLPPRRARG